MPSGTLEAVTNMVKGVLNCLQPCGDEKGPEERRVKGRSIEIALRDRAKVPDIRDQSLYTATKAVECF